MINLIPNQEKKKKVKDFYFRLAVVFFAALGFCALVATLSILPTYFLSSVEKNIAAERLLSQKSEPESPADEDLSLSVEDLDRKLRILKQAESRHYLVSEQVIQRIAGNKMPDIKITYFMYAQDPAGGKKITISGIAPSRERLLLFRRALEEDPSFKKVDLPISNFVRGSDIHFSLTIIPI